MDNYNVFIQDELGLKKQDTEKEGEKKSTDKTESTHSGDGATTKKARTAKTTGSGKALD